MGHPIPGSLCLGGSPRYGSSKFLYWLGLRVSPHSSLANIRIPLGERGRSGSGLACARQEAHLRCGSFDFASLRSAPLRMTSLKGVG